MELIEAEGTTISVHRGGEGPDLLLLHSLLTDRHAFDPSLPALETRWRVNQVDMPGFGHSSVAAASIDAQADAMGRLLASGGYDPATTAIIGNGWGAFVALGTAVRYGERFDKLVLVGCGTGFPPAAKTAFEGMIERVEEGGMDAVIDTAVARIFPPDHRAAHPEVVAERGMVLLRTPPQAFVAACQALIEVDYSGSLGEVGNPTLVVVGGQDEATPPVLAREVAAGIAASTLVELEGVGHAPQLQAPDRFVEAVASFLGLQEAVTLEEEGVKS